MTSPTNQLFLRTISASSVFQLMTPSDQAALLASYQSATDAQLLEAIRAIQEEDQKFQASEQARQTQAQNQITLSEQLHASLKKSEKQLLRSEEEQEQAQNTQELQKIETELCPSTPTIKAPRKKFLGLF